MPRRSLLACTAVVLIAHGALIEALTRHAVTQTGAPPPAARTGERLVLLDRATTAALSPAPVERASEPASAPAEPASAPDAPPDTRAAPSPAHPASANGAAPLRGPGMAIYRSPAELDVPLRTRSAPDLSILNGLPWSGLPIRLRLFIDSRGDVVDTQVLKSDEATEVVDRVRQMFRATGFTQGTVRGAPVPSYKDIEILVGSPPR